MILNFQLPRREKSINFSWLFISTEGYSLNGAEMIV